MKWPPWDLFRFSLRCDNAPAVPAALYEPHPLFADGLPAERSLPWHLPPREWLPPARVFTPGFPPGSRL